jgi:catechol 2,3-dioxygenase-like lactoylglutathione lyase family enzyme
MPRYAASGAGSRSLIFGKEHAVVSSKPTFGFALEYVTDIEAAKRFYVDVLGLDVEREHPTFVQFTSFAIASDESLGGGDDPELYWLVDDAEAAFRDLSPKAEVSLPLKQMPFGKVFGIKDPAGRPRYLVELAPDRPSRRPQ